MKTNRMAGALAAVTLALAVAACAPGGSEGPSADTAASQNPAAEGFPITIEHVYGTTTIESKPERIATVAWANHEVPLALGIVPVGMAAADWGDDDNDGVLPWVEDALTELGAETPVLFDEVDGIDFEAVADTNPDLILATYSGITQEEYDTLSKIAPVVAYPEVAWGTSWQDMVLVSSEAMGLAAEGEALVAELEAEVQASLADHPSLADKKVLFSFLDVTNLGEIGFYTSHDTRPGFLEELGLPVPDAVVTASGATTEFWASVSSERADDFADVDLFVTYGEPDSDLIAQLQADPRLSTIPAIAAGRVAILANSTPLAASANPSPLSIRWGIDDYFALLSAPLE